MRIVIEDCHLDKDGQSGIRVDETISKVMFEELVKKRVMRLDEGLDHLLKQCALSPMDIVCSLPVAGFT